MICKRSATTSPQPPPAPVIASYDRPPGALAHLSVKLLEQPVPNKLLWKGQKSSIWWNIISPLFTNNSVFRKNTLQKEKPQMWTVSVHARDTPAGRAEADSPKPPALPSWAGSGCMAEKSGRKQVRWEERRSVLKGMYKERQGTDLSAFPGNNSVLYRNLRLKDRPVNHNRKSVDVFKLSF